jgi:hypothetical protein
MTFTSHGHHIPGSPDYDESEKVPVSRCGGPNLCSTCKHEAQHYVNGRAGARMKMHAEANGSGQLTAGELMHQLLGIPPEAILHIRTDGDQRDGPYWSVKAEWDRAETPMPEPTSAGVSPSEIYRHTKNMLSRPKVGDSQTRDIQVPIGGDGGFSPRPTTGPITQQNEQHYGKRGPDEYFGISGVGVNLGE